MKKTTNIYKKYGPTAVVIGASYGIGFEFARSLAQRGFDLILVARNHEKLEAAASLILKEFHVSVSFFSIDVGQNPKKVVEICQGKDIGLVIYNAAYSIVSWFEQSSFEEMSSLLNVNVNGITYISKSFGEKFLAERKGRKSGLILVSSSGGISGSAIVCLYGATKSFITSLASGLWSEWRNRGIDVRSPVLPPVDTPTLVNTGAVLSKMPGILTSHDTAEKSLQCLGGIGPRHYIGWASYFCGFLDKLLPRSLVLMAFETTIKSIYANKLNNQ